MSFTDPEPVYKHGLETKKQRLVPNSAVFIAGYCSNRFRIAQILFPVDLDATVGADIARILVELVDLLIKCCCFQLTHM